MKRKAFALFMIATVGVMTASCGQSREVAEEKSESIPPYESASSTSSSSDAISEYISDNNLEDEVYDTSDDSPESIEDVLGEVTDTGYKNEYFGISITIPDGWVDSSDKMEKVKNMGEEKIEESGIITDGGEVYYEYMIDSSDYSTTVLNLTVTVSERSAYEMLLSEEEYWNNLMYSLEYMLEVSGAENITSSLINIGEDSDMPVIKAAGTISATGDVIYYSYTLPINKGKYNLTVTTTGIDEARALEALNSISFEE